MERTLLQDAPIGITHIQIHLDIFDRKIDVVFAGDFEAALDYVDEDFEYDGELAMTLITPDKLYVLINSTDCKLWHVVHEAVHVTHHVMKACGIRDDDELRAYMVEAIGKEICKLAELAKINIVL